MRRRTAVCRRWPSARLRCSPSARMRTADSGKKNVSTEPDERVPRGSAGRTISTVRDRVLRGDDRRRRREIDYTLSLLGPRGRRSAGAHPLRAAQRQRRISVWLCEHRGEPVRRAHPPRPARQAGTVTGTITALEVIGPTGQGIAAGEFDELVAAMRAGDAYANVHSSHVPGRRDPRPDQRRQPAGRLAAGDGSPGVGLARARPHARASSRRITASPNSAARAPSTTRWSNVTAIVPVRRTTTSPSRTTGRGATRPMLRIATSGWLTIGVWKRPASLPALVTVNVESAYLLRLQGPGARAVREPPELRRRSPPRERESAPRTTGTTSPCSVWTATPMS